MWLPRTMGHDSAVNDSKMYWPYWCHSHWHADDSPILCIYDDELRWMHMQLYTKPTAKHQWKCPNVDHAALMDFLHRVYREYWQRHEDPHKLDFLCHIRLPLQLLCWDDHSLLGRETAVKFRRMNWFIYLIQIPILESFRNLEMSALLWMCFDLFHFDREFLWSTFDLQSSIQLNSVLGHHLYWWVGSIQWRCRPSCPAKSYGRKLVQVLINSLNRITIKSIKQLSMVKYTHWHVSLKNQTHCRAHFHHIGTIGICTVCKRSTIRHRQMCDQSTCYEMDVKFSLKWHELFLGMLTCRRKFFRHSF